MAGGAEPPSKSCDFSLPIFLREQKNKKRENLADLIRMSEKRTKKPSCQVPVGIRLRTQVLAKGSEEVA
jgi:hypothetical protein